MLRTAALGVRHLVKQSSSRQRADVLQARLEEFQDKVFQYEPGDLETLCDLTQTVVMGYEYWIVSKKQPVLHGPFQQELKNWYRQIFEKQICLVLRHNEKLYSYSRKYIFKKLRGVVAHSDGEIHGEDRGEAFHYFVFEEDGVPVVFEFVLTFKWLISGAYFLTPVILILKTPLERELV
jgi:hypothetical protein